MAIPYRRLDKQRAAVLLVDHQTGLLSLVRDIEPDTFVNNVLALADLARYFELPTLLPTSFENGPNGPLLPELKERFPDAPYIARPGQINAWDNEDFVAAVKATGRQQLIIAGVVTEVCVAFPALAAIEEGLEVFVVTDASGTFNALTRDSAWARMSAAGAPMASAPPLPPPAARWKPATGTPPPRASSITGWNPARGNRSRRSAGRPSWPASSISRTGPMR